ncbi:MAG TPA: hypothetical protein VIL72_09320 [Beijerinckiaceae bacterium]|jgi:hypothetical protein
MTANFASNGRFGPRDDDEALSIVSPASGIANDYLNLFNEVTMLIEQLPTMPELVDDLFAWRPVSYEEYFGRSQLAGSKTALEVYQRLDAGFRVKFEAAVKDLDNQATAALVTIRRHLRARGDQAPQTLAAYCARCGQQLREALDRATAIVNHGAVDAVENAQQRADRLLQVRINALRDLEENGDARAWG